MSLCLGIGVFLFPFFFMPIELLFFHLFRSALRARAHVHARMRTLHVERTCVCRGSAPRSTIGMYGEKKTIARCPCTPPLTVGERISSSTGSGREIAD